MRIFATSLILLLLLASRTAEAHPHIFARYHVTLGEGEKGFAHVHFVFTFQAVTNPFLGKGIEDPQQLTPDMVSNLSAHPFYIYLSMDGEDLGRQRVIPALIPGPKSDQQYAFDIEVPDNVKNYSFALYDPTYFVSVQLDGPQALNAKESGLKCRSEDREIGQTVWGALRAAFVICGDGTTPPTLSKIKPNAPPLEDGSLGMSSRKMVP